MVAKDVVEKDETPKLMDEDMLEIAEFCSDQADRTLKSVTRDLETEVSLRCARPELDTEGKCDALAVLPYLHCVRGVLEQMLHEEGCRFSKARWLWMLRRLPDSLFEGKVSTTRPYDATLATAASGLFGSDKSESPYTDAGGTVRFKVDGSTLPRLLRFAMIARWLSQSHVLLRYCGKGVRFYFPPNSRIPDAAPTEEEKKNIRQYDARVASATSFLTTSGTVISSPSALSESAFLMVHFSNVEWVKVPARAEGKDIEANVLKRFMPETESLAQLERLNQDARLSGLAWWGTHSARLLALARGAFVLMGGQANGLASALRFGYQFVSEESYVNALGSIWAELTEDVRQIIPGAILPISAEEHLAELCAIQPTLWPLSPGPVIRRAGDALWVDLVASTAILQASLEFPRGDGDAANARADHFEDTTQEVINNTPWVPSPELAKVRRLTVKRSDGRELTDLDAVGEKDDCLLLVSCKSVIYSRAYDIGEFNVVRNMRTMLEEAAKYWNGVVDYLRTNPKGSNYDFSKYKLIIPVVCTPHVAYLTDPFALRFVAPKLRAACSLDELKTWLVGGRVC